MRKEGNFFSIGMLRKYLKLLIFVLAYLLLKYSIAIPLKNVLTKLHFVFLMRISITCKILSLRNVDISIMKYRHSCRIGFR